jgi:hypothetical protein
MLAMELIQLGILCMLLYVSYRTATAGLEQYGFLVKVYCRIRSKESGEDFVEISKLIRLPSIPRIGELLLIDPMGSQNSTVEMVSTSSDNTILFVVHEYGGSKETAEDWAVKLCQIGEEWVRPTGWVTTDHELNPEWYEDDVWYWK